MRALYGYYRSSASYRVRIALALKGLDYQYKAINLAPGASEHRGTDYLAINPQGRVPFFVDGDVRLSQSPAILEYLEEVYPAVALLPADPAERAKVRQFASLIACDIHPLNNLSVLGYLKKDFKQEPESVDKWYAHWILKGFEVLEEYLQNKGSNSFCVGNAPTLADVYLIPQIWNARRFNVPLDGFPVLQDVEAHCMSLKAFQQSAPEYQPDTPKDA